MLKRIFIVLALVVLFAPPAHADFAAGLKAYNARHWEDAIINLRPLADRGDDRAMILLGNMYDNGYGVIVNYKEAMRLYKRAALTKNNPQAMNAIGAMYVDGQGTQAHLETAVAWFLRSARLGDQTGAFFAATIFYEGNTNPFNTFHPDLAKAYKWYKICASEKQKPGYTKFCARAAKGLAVKFLKKDQVAKLDKEIAAWKPVKAKELGPPPPDPKPPGKAEIRKHFSHSLKQTDKSVYHPKAVLP